MLSEAQQFDAIIATPVGPVGIALRQNRVCRLGFLDQNTPLRAPASAVMQALSQRLQGYFSERTELTDLAVDLVGTPFQQRVWAELRRIPCGQVLTYGQLARRLGTGPRAIGGACRANPCPLLVPCHRVVAADGKGGFGGASAGRWMQIKAALLRHEGVVWPD